MSDIRIRIHDQRNRPHAVVAMARFVAFAAILFGPGIWFDSVALQWAGFVFLTLLGCTSVLNAVGKPMTIPEARKALDRLEALEREA